MSTQLTPEQKVELSQARAALRSVRDKKKQAKLSIERLQSKIYSLRLDEQVAIRQVTALGGRVYYDHD